MATSLIITVEPIRWVEIVDFQPHSHYSAKLANNTMWRIVPTFDISDPTSIAIGDCGIAAGRHLSLKAHVNESSARSMKDIRPPHPTIVSHFSPHTLFHFLPRTLQPIILQTFSFHQTIIHNTKTHSFYQGHDMSHSFLSLAVLVLGVLTQNSAAYFRMSCSEIQVGRIDPIVNPKSFSPHAHKISGPSSKYRSKPILLEPHGRALSFLRNAWSLTATMERPSSANLSHRLRLRLHLRIPPTGKLHLLRDPRRQIRLLDPAPLLPTQKRQLRRSAQRRHGDLLPRPRGQQQKPHRLPARFPHGLRQRRCTLLQRNPQDLQGQPAHRRPRQLRLS